MKKICLYCQHLIVDGNDYSCQIDDSIIPFEIIDLPHCCGSFESINNK
jgi:hypothetical protein